MVEQQAAEVTIRRARREDVPEIVRLLADDVLGQQREHYGADLPESYYAAFDEIDGDKNNELVVVELDGAIVGTLQLTFIRYLSYQGGKRAQVEAVRVDERYRNQKIGEKLMQWVIERAKAEKCHVLQLTTTKSREAAQRFYRRLGFVASHEGMKLDLTK